MQGGYSTFQFRHESMQSPHRANQSQPPARRGSRVFTLSPLSSLNSTDTRTVHKKSNSTQGRDYPAIISATTGSKPGLPIIEPTAPRQRKKQATPDMPPRKSTSSVTPADPEEASLLSPVAPAPDKPITATEQQIKARAELGVSVDVSIPTLNSLLISLGSA